MTSASDHPISLLAKTHVLPYLLCSSSLVLVKPTRGEGPTHVFPRSASEPKFGFTRSKTTVTSSHSGTKTAPSSDSSESEDPPHSPSSRRSSIHRRSDSNASKPPSRPTSRASRKRSDSTGTAGGKEGNKEKEKHDKSRRLSVAGWASSAVGSVTGRGKKKFSALADDELNGAEGEDDEQISKSRASSSQSNSRKSPRNKSKESLPSSSPKVPIRILKPPSLQGRKVVRALHDFTGSSDELSFKAGDEILVVSEVLDGWWMGELDGRKGLFPTPYTEVIPSKTPSRRPTKNLGSSLSSEDDTRKPTSAHTDSDEYATSELEEEQVFRAQHLLPTHSPFYGGATDAASITSSVAEEEEKQGLMSKSQSQSQSQGQKIFQSLYPSQPAVTRRSTTTDVSSSTSISGKKAPPPPPPRRSMNNVSSTSPPIPERLPNRFRTQSSSSLPTNNVPTPASSISSNGYDTSPFESAAEISTAGCTDFKQNPFKANGMCSNCFEMHT